MALSNSDEYEEIKKVYSKGDLDNLMIELCLLKNGNIEMLTDDGRTTFNDLSILKNYVKRLTALIADIEFKDSFKSAIKEYMEELDGNEDN